MGRDEKKKVNPQEVLAAIAVASIAAWSPGQETYMLMRIIYAALALSGLFVASVGLEMAQEYMKTKAEPKVNPFEVKIMKVDLPTAPPGGVFEASCKMEEYLNGFPITLSSDVRRARTPTTTKKAHM